MAHRSTSGSPVPPPLRPDFLSMSRTRSGTRLVSVLARILFVALFHVAQANKKAFIQTDTILEVFHFGDEGLLQTESDINSYHQKSLPLHRGNTRPIRFEPPMLDFHEQPVGMPKMEKVYLHNPSQEEISLISISATTAHFHASFFQNRIIHPGGNTSFDVVFLARVVGNVENTLFINTSHHGVFTYQVFGVGIPNPYRLRPFIGARVPVNSSFSPLINIHNPHSEPLQVVEMYSSGGDLHLELPTGQQGGTRNLWEIPPFETKGVMRASFSSREADNHTAFIRIKTNASDPDQFIILPVEVEVTSAPGIYSSIEMLDFGTLRSQDKPKILNLHLLNSGTKDVQITSIRVSPPNDAVTIEFKAVTLKAAEHKYTKVASISYDASKVQKTSQSSGKITVKAKEKSYSKLEIPYQAEVLDGYLGFDHTVTLFHIRDSVTEPMLKPIHLTNTFHFDISVHDVALPDEAHAMFKVLNFTDPVLIPPQASRYIFSLEFSPLRPSTHIDSNILLVTNASKFHLPIRAYTGFLEPLVLPPSLSERFLDFGVLSATDASSILFVVFNSNPIELVLQPWQVTGESVSVELLKTERGNRTDLFERMNELDNTSPSPHKTVILASGYYAVFRVTLLAKDLEGQYNAAIHITTDFEILTIPVKAVVAVGTLNSFPKLMVLPPSFPGKIVHQSFSIISTFSQSVKLLRIHSVSNDKRFYYRRLKTSRDELEPKRKSKVAKIYFDASIGCGDSCYVGVPFITKSEARPSGMVMQEDMWDTDVDLFQTLSKRWAELDESQQYTAEATFEANADLQKSVQTRVSAQLKWPSIIKSSDNGRLGVFFPLTSVNSSSEVEVVLENPSDSPLYIQILPLAHYPNLCSVTAKLGQMFPLERLPHFTPRTLEFQVIGNQGTVPRSKTGFVEGSRMPYVYNLPLQPDEVKTLRVKFSPISNHTVTSLLMFRNNLTVLEFVVVQGSGCYESIKLGGKSPGPGGFLRFKMVESHLKECTDKSKPREPNLTLRRSFKMENTGQLQIDILSIEINGRPCEGYGFKVLNCQEFSLQPNASRDLLILFTPDFTASRVIREMKLTTAGGSQFVFSLNASLPYHMLATCSTTLPRPTWELELYILISLTMSSMFLLVVVTAYLEALGIWDLFQKRLCFESSGPSMETGKPFDLREIVRLQNSNAQSSARNSKGGGGGGNNRTSLTPSSSSQPGLKAVDGGGTQSPTQLINRKPRSTASKQQQQQQSSGGSASAQQGGAPVLLPRGTSPRQEEQDYESLVEAMDKDLDRPESTTAEELESPSSTQGKGAKGKVQRKPKTPKRTEEADGRPKGKAQGEEAQREDNDDNSSTTTEDSYRETEAGPREEQANNKKGKPLTLEKDKEEITEQRIKSKNKKPGNTKERSQMSSSLELPYVTPLENKRKSFTPSKSVINALASTSSSANTKVLPSNLPRVPRGGKLDDIRPSPLLKFLAGGPRSSSSSSGSEGENNISPPPEWDVPLCKNSGLMDSLQQISMQTINADPFLKRPIGTPPPGSARISTGSPSSYSPIELEPKSAVGSKSKLTKSVSLPGQNGNPTFAAVAAGYDKSPGGSSSNRGARTGFSHMSSLDSDCSDSILSPGLLGSVENGRAPGVNSPFSAFGTSPLFNLPLVFSGMTSSRTSEARQAWPEFGSRPPPASTSPTTSMWPSDPLEPWPPRSTATPTTNTSTSILGSSSVWSPSPPFSRSIWSLGADSASPLHSSFPSPASSAGAFPPPGSVSTFPPTPISSSSSFPSPPPPSMAPPSSPVLAPSSSSSSSSSSHLADLMGCVVGDAAAANVGNASPTYNPWSSTWGVPAAAFGRRSSSEPWPSNNNGNNNSADNNNGN